MAVGNMFCGQPANKTASGNVKASAGQLLGFYVNSTTSGTIALYDDAGTGTSLPISGTITPAIGWHFYPVGFANGLNVVIGSTLNVTLIYL
jgi:hypothetical protein